MLATSPPVIILFITANPPDSQQLDLDTERRELLNALRGRRYGERFEVKHLFAARVSDILQGLREHQPTVVHFSAHGDSYGNFYLNAANRTGSQFLSAEDLTEKLRVYQAEADRRVKLAVLAGCFTAGAAKVVLRHVDCVIGMDDAIGDVPLATVFTPSLYAALADGRSVQNAVDSAKSALRSDEEHRYDEDAAMVQLESRDGVDPTSVILTELVSTQRISTQRHLAYLRSLFGEDCDWAKVSMSLFDPQEMRLARKVSLLDIFTPLPVDFTIAIEVSGAGQDREWWCGAARGDSASQVEREWFDIAWSERMTRAASGEKPEGHRLRLRSWTDLDVTEEGLTPLIAMADRWAVAIADRWAVDRRRDKQTLIWQADASHAALVQPRFVLIGDPGSGKSTFLRHLALCWAGHLLRAAGQGDVPAAATLDALPGWTRAYTPIYIELRTLVSSFAPLSGSSDQAHDPPGLKELRRHLRNHLPGKQDDDLIDDLFSLLRQGKAALLLDGLDEVSEASVPERQNQIHGFVSTLVSEFQQAPILVTARPYAYERQEWMIQGFGHTTLAPLGSGRQGEFAKRLMGRLLQTDRTRDAAREINAFLVALPTIRDDLRSNPLLLTLLVALWIRKEPGERDLPSTRGELYRRAVTLLVKDWVTSKHKDDEEEYKLPVGEKDWRIVLEQVAFDAQERRRSHEEPGTVLASDIFRALNGLGKGREAVDLLDHLSYQANILERVPVLEETYDGQYKFLHGTFQEYLAACELLYREEDARPPGLPLFAGRRFPVGLANRMVAAPILWANVLRFAVDELIVRRRIPDAYVLLAHCCEPYRDGNEGKQAALLALQVALDAELLDKAKHAGATAYDVLREDARNILLNHESFTPEQRDIAGRLLGRGSFPGHDMRKGVALRKDGLPDFDWVTIPEIDPQTGKGEWTYRNKKHKPLETFWIVRYLITHAQFEVFLRADDGFRVDCWWRGLDVSEGHRSRAGQQRFEYWNHPSDRVSWWDAMAFCAWLTEKATGRSGFLPDDPGLSQGWRIILPTEQQWEKAARGHDGRQYPWGGKDYKSGYANIVETWSSCKVGPHYLQKTTAVGMYPQGVSPYGVADLSGNVWEWCLNEYGKPERIRLEGDASRVLRGGSWSYNVYDAAAPVRYVSHPVNRDFDYGFRVCAVIRQE